MKRIATLVVLLAACSDTTPTGTNQLNIDRPVDISFACYGGLRVTNGQPPTADEDSGDMSYLDINSALASVYSGGPSATVDRLDVTTPGGAKLRSRPAAMAMQPPGGTIGVTCGATATGLVYVAYPSCHAVVAV